jgi:hypothetical protein
MGVHATVALKKYGRDVDETASQKNLVSNALFMW